MNAERLHAVVKAVLDEIVGSATLEALEGLVNALDASLNSPTNPDLERSAGEFRQQLTTSLSAAPSDSFTPLWREALDELGLSNVLGMGLLRRVEDAFAGNDLTKAIALDRLRSIHADLNTKASAAGEVLRGMAALAIEWEELPPGQAELGLIIPRAFVHNELGELGRELDKFKKLLWPFQELATGSVPVIGVRSISSSAFTFLLDIDPNTLRLIAESIGTLLQNYKLVLDIREHLAAIKDTNALSEATIGHMEADATEIVNTKIGELVTAILNENREHLRGDGRENEVSIGLEKSLTGLAFRIERGVGFEARVTPLELEAPADEDDPNAASPDPETVQRQAILDEIQALASRLESLSLPGDPILQLEDPQLDDPPDHD